MDNTIVKLSHICKRFPGVLANDDACLEVREGEVHALLGENGSGKSTLMSILCGLYKPTSGEIAIKCGGACKPVRFGSARDAMMLGIGMVHQHFMLVPSFTVVENCLIGERTRGVKLDVKGAAEKIGALAEQYHLRIDPNAKVEGLSVGERQRVEIIKALYRGARILILDEPSAVLTPQETDDLFCMIRSLIASGYTVLFISHKLHEVKAISDRVTVMRLGKIIGTYDVKDCSVQDLARLMMGRDVDFSVQRAKREPGAAVLDVRGLSFAPPGPREPKLLSDLNFEVREGEIVGIAGVDGNGQPELVDCLTGMQAPTAGEVFYCGQDMLRWDTRKIMSSGVSHIPQDRHKSGLVLTMNLTENLMLQDYYKSEFGSGPFVDWKYAAAYSERLIEGFNIKTTGRLELAQNLSGGNQQCVIVARELSRHPKLIIAMHPTRGLDVGRIEYIHRLLIQQRDSGLAILLISTELEEIMKLSDRVYTLYEGRFMGETTPRDTSREEMGLMMGGTPLERIR